MMYQSELGTEVETKVQDLLNITYQKWLAYRRDFFTMVNDSKIDVEEETHSIFESKQQLTIICTVLNLMDKELLLSHREPLITLEMFDILKAKLNHKFFEKIYLKATQSSHNGDINRRTLNILREKIEDMCELALLRYTELLKQEGQNELRDNLVSHINGKEQNVLGQELSKEKIKQRLKDELRITRKDIFKKVKTKQAIAANLIDVWKYKSQEYRNLVSQEEKREFRTIYYSTLKTIQNHQAEGIVKKQTNLELSHLKVTKGSEIRNLNEESYKDIMKTSSIEKEPGKQKGMALFRFIICVMQYVNYFFSNLFDDTNA